MVFSFYTHAPTHGLLAAPGLWRLWPPPSTVSLSRDSTSIMTPGDRTIVAKQRCRRRRRDVTTAAATSIFILNGSPPCADCFSSSRSTVGAATAAAVPFPRPSSLVSSSNPGIRVRGGGMMRSGAGMPSKASAEDGGGASEEDEIVGLKKKLTGDFFKIGAPAFVQLAAEPLASIVDTAYLGRLGPEVSYLMC